MGTIRNSRNINNMVGIGLKNIAIKLNTLFLTLIGIFVLLMKIWLIQYNLQI